MTEKNKHRIFLSPYQSIGLEVMEEVFNYPPIIDELKLPKMDFQGIFFSTMIQCGIDEFVMIASNKEKISKYCNSDFLSNRISYDSKLDHQYLQLSKKLDLLLAEYIDNKNLSKSDSVEIHTTQIFLTDLLFEMKSNLGSVSTRLSPTPNLERLKTIFEPDLYYPIRNLVLSLEHDNLNLPLPTQSILHNNVQKYEKIIDSDIFSTYANAHQQLENNSISKLKAFAQINRNAKKLQTRFKRYINLKNLAMSSINTVTFGADFFGGKICGIISESLFKLLDPIIKDYLSNDKRLVIYQFSPITEEIFRDRILNRLSVD